jgi:flavin reductase (DIM6/NTAB) family NADH-FMN oxidoreductase RutF
MNFTEEDIKELDRFFRLNLINALTGIKPANLIGTISNVGEKNLAIFSSVIHLGSNPPLIGFIVRPTDEVPRHTYENIRENGFYTINHVHREFIEQAHYTAAKFDRAVSEFEVCRLTEEYVNDFPAPFIKESRLKLGMQLEQELPIALNGTILMIGSIKLAIVPDEIISDEGYLNLEKADDVGISGLNSYYALKKIADFPYARVEQLPDFSDKK